jgi:hypothetical protein
MEGERKASIEIEEARNKAKATKADAVEEGAKKGDNKVLIGLAIVTVFGFYFMSSGSGGTRAELPPNSKHNSK